MSYKNFTRKVEKLKQGKFISTKKVAGGGGNTTIITYSEKKLTDFQHWTLDKCSREVYKVFFNFNY